MSDYLASRQPFTLTAESTIEAVLKSGQKLQYDSPATLKVSRATVPYLPPNCSSTVINGINYFNCGGMFYRAGFQGDSIVYIVSVPSVEESRGARVSRDERPISAIGYGAISSPAAILDQGPI
jgi:Predicted periplasmic protein (DUF2092)